MKHGNPCMPHCSHCRLEYNLPAPAKLTVRHGELALVGSVNICTTSFLSIQTHSSSPPENANISVPLKLNVVRTAAVNLKTQIRGSDFNKGDGFGYGRITNGNFEVVLQGTESACVEFHNKIVQGTKQDPVSFLVASVIQRDRAPKTVPQCKRMAKTV